MTTPKNGKTGNGRLYRAREVVDAARVHAGQAWQTAQTRASTAYQATQSSGRRARQTIADAADSHPVAVLAGGLALGGLLAVLLPRTKREDEWFGDYGRHISDHVRQTARAAAEAGKDRLEELGYNREKAREKIEALKTDAAAVAKAVLKPNL